MISVILGFKNESSNLEELINRTVSTLENTSEKYEIIFIDDDSKDNSREIILNEIKKNKNLKYIKLSRNFGIAQSLICGLENSSGDAIVYLDSDLQDPPELIKDMYEKIKEGYHIINTVRTKRHGETKTKLVLTNFAYSFLKLFIKPTILKNSGDFKMITGLAKDKFLEIKEKDPFMRGLSAKIGLKQTEIFYERSKRSKGKSKFPIFASLNPYREIFRAITTHNSSIIYFPVFMSVILGFFSIILIISSWLNILNLSWWNYFLIFSLNFILMSIATLSIYIDRLIQNTKEERIYYRRKI